jgi:dienelactone hydrolase
LKARATAAGKNVTTKIHREAGHALLADCPPGYRERPAFEAWTDITDYFGGTSSSGDLTERHRAPVI